MRRLSVEFPAGSGKVMVLNDVSFDIGKGEVLALVGESGSGKTVTALSILQLLPKLNSVYSSGDLLFRLRNGEIINLNSVRGKRLIGVRGKEIALVSQEPMSALNPSIACGVEKTASGIVRFAPLLYPFSPLIQPLPPS